MSSKLAISLVIGSAVAGALAGIKKVKTESLSLGSVIKGVGGEQARLAKMQSLVAERSQLLGKAMHTTAGLAFFATPIESAIKFESAMADVRKVVDFDTPDQFKEMEKQLLELSTKIPLTAEQLAQIAASGGQLGVAREDIKGFVEEIAKMSVAFDMSTEESGDAMAKLANVYKIPIKEIGSLGDAINDLSNSSPAKASEIVATLGRIGGVAKQFGLTANGATALGGAFIALGKRPEVAGTAINGMLTRLMTADKQGKQFQETLEQMGFSAEGLKSAINENSEQALLDFLKAVQKLPKDSQMGALVDLFGREYADDVAVLTGNVELLENNLSRLSGGKYLGSMQKEFEARSKTTANNLTLLKSTVTKLGVTLGSVFLPILNDVVNAIKPVVEGITSFFQANPALAKTILGVVGTMLVFKATSLATLIGLNFIKTGIISTIGGFSTLATAVMKVGKLFPLLNAGFLILKSAFIKLGAVMLANPIGLVVTAVVGLVAGFMYLWKNCEGFRQFWLNLWENIKNVYRPVINFISQSLGGLVGNFPTLTQVIAGFSEFFINAWTGIKNGFGVIAQWIGNKVQWVGNAISTVSNVLSGVASFFGFGDKKIDINQTTKQKQTTEHQAIPSSTPTSQTLLARANPQKVAPPTQQGVITATFSPTINIQGNADKKAIREQLTLSQRQFEEMLRKAQQNQLRRSYT